MDLGTFLSLSSVILLATEVVLAIQLRSYANKHQHKPGGHLLRTLTRCFWLIVLAQVIEVYLDVRLDLVAREASHWASIGLETLAVVLIFASIAYAYWDLTRRDWLE